MEYVILWRLKSTRKAKETAMNEAQQLSNENADLHKSCDFVRAEFCDADNQRSPNLILGCSFVTHKQYLDVASDSVLCRLLYSAESGH